MHSSSLVAVTGAGGFLGRTLISRLASQNIQVRAITRSGRVPALPGVAALQADVLSADELVPMFRGIDVVFHLVAHSHDLKSLDDSALQEAVTLGSTSTALQAAERAGVANFIFCSSLAVVGPVGNTVAREDHPCRPETPYGRAKLAAEEQVAQFAQRTGASASCIRPPMMYGVGCRGNLPRMIQAVRRRVFPPLPEFGNRRSMVAVEDVAQAMVLAWRSNVGGGRPFIVTDDHGYTTREMLDLIRAALGRRGPSVQLPRGIFTLMARLGDVGGRMLGRRMPFDSKALVKLAGSAQFDCSRAKREIGYVPSRTLQDALPAMIAHLANGR